LPQEDSILLTGPVLRVGNFPLASQIPHNSLDPMHWMGRIHWHEVDK